MEESKIVLGIVGGHNPDRPTNQLVLASSNGSAEDGTTTLLIQLSKYIMAARHGCLPWICADNLKCTYGDKEG